MRRFLVRKEKFNTKEALKSSAELGLNTILELTVDYGSQELKEIAGTITTELAIDAGVSIIPGLSGAFQSYKRNRFERNIKLALEETLKRMEEIYKYLKNKSDEQKNEINKMF